MVAGDLAAVAAEVDPALFEAAQANPDLNERGWLAGALEAHDELVRTVFAMIPLVPLRFGALVAGRAGVEELLVTEHERLRAALDVARDTAEWRVRVIPHRPSGVDIREAERERWLELAGQVHAMLSVYAVETYGLVQATRDVYLVRRRDENVFSTAAFALAGLLSGTPMKLEISGPAPPYHLVGEDRRP
jgi:hypothetical protein